MRSRNNRRGHGGRVLCGPAGAGPGQARAGTGLQRRQPRAGENTGGGGDARRGRRPRSEPERGQLRIQRPADLRDSARRARRLHQRAGELLRGKQRVGQQHERRVLLPRSHDQPAGKKRLGSEFELVLSGEYAALSIPHQWQIGQILYQLDIRAI